MGNPEPIRILIADDHAIVREGLAALIDTQPDMTLLGEAVDGQDAVNKVIDLHPDVTLMDLVMPVKTGIEAIRDIKQHDASACILVLTSYLDDDYVFPAIKAGALGYILKDSQPTELLQAIRDVARGEPSLHASVARKLMQGFDTSASLTAPTEQLTPREIAVLKLMAQGLEDTAIATQLDISQRTVRSHIRNILDKLRLSNRIQAALYALRQGLITLED